MKQEDKLIERVINRLETSEEFMSRLDRDSIYRIHALANAVERAELHRSIRNDNTEVFTYAEAYYNWLMGDGNGHGEPKREQPR